MGDEPWPYGGTGCRARIIGSPPCKLWYDCLPYRGEEYWEQAYCISGACMCTEGSGFNPNLNKCQDGWTAEMGTLPPLGTMPPPSGPGWSPETGPRWVGELPPQLTEPNDKYLILHDFIPGLLALAFFLVTLIGLRKSCSLQKPVRGLRDRVICRHS